MPSLISIILIIGLVSFIIWLKNNMGKSKDIADKTQHKPKIQKYCSQCGAPLEEGAKFCGNCGAKV